MHTGQDANVHVVHHTNVQDRAREQEHRETGKKRERTGTNEGKQRGKQEKGGENTGREKVKNVSVTKV